MQLYLILDEGFCGLFLNFSLRTGVVCLRSPSSSSHMIREATWSLLSTGGSGDHRSSWLLPLPSRFDSLMGESGVHSLRFRAQRAGKVGQGCCCCSMECSTPVFTFSAWLRLFTALLRPLLRPPLEWRLLQFPGGELGLPFADPFPFPGKKAPPEESEKDTHEKYVSCVSEYRRSVQAFSL